MKRNSQNRTQSRVQLGAPERRLAAGFAYFSTRTRQHSRPQFQSRRDCVIQPNRVARNELPWEKVELCRNPVGVVDFFKSVLLFILLLTFSIAGCATPKRAEIDFYRPLKSEVKNRIVDSIERTPTYEELCRRAKRPLLDIDEEENGWVWVDLYSVGRETNHRWATMKVNVQSGLVMRLDSDENGEDKWTVEHNP
jgi:hypothetical protein